MELSALAGNHRLKAQLSQQEEGRGLSHAYIISGPVGSGRRTLARLLSGAMLCTSATKEHPCGQCASCKKVLRGIHPDVSVISSGGPGKSITVDQVRVLRSDAYIRPNEAKRKIYLLEQADQMNPSAQNAMLKLLEDGPSYGVFFLIVDNAGGLLPTVRSRCEELALQPVALAEGVQWLKERCPQKSEEELHQAVVECQGILGRAVERLEEAGVHQSRVEKARRLVQVLELGDELEVFEAALVLEQGSREELIPFLDVLEGEVGNRILGGGNRQRLFQVSDLVKQLGQAAQFYVNPGQLAGWLCAGLFSAPAHRLPPTLAE